VTRQLLLLPGPVPVAQPVLEAMAHPMVNHRGGEFAKMLARVERALKPVFGTQGDVVVLGCSGTGGLEAAAVNLFSCGDRLLSCAVGVFGKRFAAISEAYGFKVEALETPLGSAVEPQALRQRLDADRGHTIAGILLTHNETSTGVQNDMAALAPIVQAHGAITLVDSVSGLGASEFRMDEWGYDVVVTASQKAFAAPPGVAMLAASPRAWDRMKETRTARFYLDLLRARESARAGQTPWTPPISVVRALDVALERYHEYGMVETFERHARYAQAVRSAFEALGFRLVSRPEAHSVTVVAAFPPEGIDAQKLLERLREGYGVVLSGGQGELSGKIVRFGTMGDVTEGDLIGAVGTIELVLADLDGRVSPGAGTRAAIQSLRHAGPGRLNARPVPGDTSAPVRVVEAQL
jgi:aspartate aminotransferase-like enzyme